MEAIIKPLRDADPLSPVPYRFLRILKWDVVSGPSTAGETRIPGPRATEINQLQPLVDAANWSGLLDRSENMFKAGHIWLLDLQRYTALSLERLDPRGAESPAAEAVKEATRELLKRNAVLVDCSYAGGVPFASDETRAWLAEISDVEDFKVRLTRPEPDDNTEAAFEPGDLDEAIELLRKKKLNEGMEILQRGIKRTTDQRSQFRARLDAARACLDANQAAWARPMLEGLQRDADTLTFNDWERSWAVELYQLLAVCYGRLAKASKGDEQQSFTAVLNEIRDTLCGLDMQAAAAVQEEL
jgi:type VI secretion system protein VasJ